VIGQVASKVGFAELATASRKLEIGLEVADLQSPGDLGGAFDTMIRKHVEAMLLVVGPLTYLLMHAIAELAVKHRLPSATNA
jgi:hypothetical protein